MSSPRARRLDLHFVEFVLTRSDGFLLKFGVIHQPNAWRETQRQDLAHLADVPLEQLNEAIEQWAILCFGAGRLPMLRDRYSHFLYRQGKRMKKIELQQTTVNRLQTVMKQEGLSSVEETVAFLLRSYDAMT